MRTLLFAAALSISSIALAQNTTNSDTPAQTEDEATQQTSEDKAEPSGQTVDDPSQSTGPQGVTQQGTDPNGQATAPAGTNQGVQGQAGTGMVVPAPNQQAAFTPRPAAGEYPPCSRTVTDNCIQTYERRTRRPRRRR